MLYLLEIRQGYAGGVARLSDVIPRPRAASRRRPQGRALAAASLFCSKIAKRLNSPKRLPRLLRFYKQDYSP